MKSFYLMIVAGLLVTALFLLWVSPDIKRIQADVQAYSSRSLLPDLPENTSQGLGK